MALLRYKPGQGYYTRTLSFIWFLTLAAALTLWIWTELSAIRENAVFWQAGSAIGMSLLFVPLLYWIVNRPKIADFMIATEQEMRKVNWPSQKEIIGSTAVVITGTLIMALILFLINIFFGAFFQSIGILNAGSGAEA
ncbi:preprotein translocase subunit SecE [Phycisphaera mikurensis]|uniref:Protein translocase subunit SecE n=1 Tax=Phycisphaera mikurensis (strain NBRC 102666 / KCTC 22515 / FYK2301M01) TaxID=1142394 RepID=I0ICK4_PHYMF|nr:preprotein translocase subunit SecE [Phycisphaera mikurensis]MBB6442131.1 preprotein translocase subunit SecE [Phycisphaera mikurensis]BAM02992.1 putative preprotein translocase SecE subunit [Phycisphaera mikurensis NBRC 102666]